jgi:uncharacterized protein (DUF1501 family)
MEIHRNASLGRPSRRHFLTAAAALSAAHGLRTAAGSLPLGLAGLGALASQRAHAQGGDYRALVCVFLVGGNDSHNWVVPTATPEYAKYAAARDDLAWPAGSLLPIGSGGQAVGRSFGMPGELQALRSWYLSGDAAIVANVGPLTRPLTLSDYRHQVGLPSKLFSHNDQQSTWQSLSPEGARSGWGGRLGDILMAANDQPVFTTVSAAGNAVFLTGAAVTKFQVGVDGPVAIRALDADAVLGSRRVGDVFRRRLQVVPLGASAAEYQRVLQRSMINSATLGSALASSSVAPLPSAPVPSGGSSVPLSAVPLAQQLRVVAQMIKAAPQLGMRRQVFMVEARGFDTHANQMRDQPGLMSQVAHSIDYFLSIMKSSGTLEQVTLFTASEFGRTLVSNGDGSDHGWGGHHFVAGGSVAGGRIHGQFPDLALGSDTDIGSGRLLPTTSVTQLAAALGGWMGISRGEMVDVLPNVGEFEPLSGLV